MEFLKLVKNLGKNFLEFLKLVKNLGKDFLDFVRNLITYPKQCGILV